jgi:hypothetical protein
VIVDNQNSQRGSARPREDSAQIERYDSRRISN